jgi:hypothetical protein
MTTPMPSPPDGGRYLRDPKTGLLTRLEDDAETPGLPDDTPPPDAPAETKGGK